MLILKSLKDKKADMKTVFFCEIVSFPPKSSERVTHNCWFHSINLLKSAVVSDPLRGIGRETYYFTLKAQFSYRLSYLTWTLAALCWDSTENSLALMSSAEICWGESLAELWQTVLGWTEFYFAEQCWDFNKYYLQLLQMLMTSKENA